MWGQREKTKDDEEDDSWLLAKAAWWITRN